MTYDWALNVVSVTDGDTLRGHLTRDLPLSNDWAITARSSDPRGMPLRLIILDTPERGQPGYLAAKADLAQFVDLHQQLRAQTYESGGFDRLLADVYAAADRGVTASQYMLQRGWMPYLP